MPKKTPYCKDTVLDILDNIASGESLRSESKRVGISPMVILKWIREHHVQEYKDAQVMRAGLYIDRIFELAQDETMDVQRARLMVDTTKWIACKLIPDVYGDKVTQEVSVNYTHYLNELPPPPPIKEVN